MKIAFVSSMRPGSWKLDLAEGIRGLGHTVVHHKDLLVTRRLPADLVVWVYHQGRAPRIPVDVAISMDLWLGLPTREARLVSQDVRQRNFWSAKWVFTADGNPCHKQRFDALGVNHHWLMPACPSRLNYHGNPSPRPLDSPKIVFVGRRVHWNPQRVEIIDTLQARYGKDFAWYGPDSPRGELRDGRLNDLYATGAIVVGDSMGVDYYWSDRVPRTLGQGGFLLQADTAGFGVAGIFQGEHCGFWDGNNLDSLIDSIDYYLENPTRRWQMASNALKLVKDRHLWEHRAEEIMRVVDQ